MKFTTSEIKYINDYSECYSDPDDIHVYENYSGRGMYGNLTDGLVVSDFMEITKLVRHICSNRDWIQGAHNIDVEDFLDKLTSLNRRDNLGYETILY